jgi:isopentenyl-diphosphate delta-isomerase
MKNLENSALSEALAVRKKAHIEFASKAQTTPSELDSRFNYEPLFFVHPDLSQKAETEFLNFKLDYPFWISSMTGGTGHAKKINQRLAKLCGEYKLGMGLGSCRALLESHERREDFYVRPFIGDQPLFANLGIAQLEELVWNNKSHLVHEMVKSLEANGLIIHLNPLQEWFQPEGDKFKKQPILTIEKFLNDCPYPVIIKEVGQGMGPRSLAALLKMPIAAIELAAFGGTNFSYLESMRSAPHSTKEALIQVGHTASEMIEIINALPKNKKNFIISGGIKSVLDGHYLLNKIQAPALIGMAQLFLAPAMEGEEELSQFFTQFRDSYLTAKGLLEIKGQE